MELLVEPAVQLGADMAAIVDSTSRKKKKLRFGDAGIKVIANTGQKWGKKWVGCSGVRGCV